MTSRFGSVVIPINQFEKLTAEWSGLPKRAQFFNSMFRIYYFSIDEMKENDFAEKFIDNNKDKFPGGHDGEMMGGEY